MHQATLESIGPVDVRCSARAALVVSRAAPAGRAVVDIRPRTLPLARGLFVDVAFLGLILSRHHATANFGQTYIVVDAFARQMRARIGPFSTGVNVAASFCFTGDDNPVVVHVSELVV